MRYKSYYRLYDYRQHNIHSTKAMIDFYPILRTLWNRKLSNFKSLQIVMGKYFHTLSKSLFLTLTLNCIFMSLPIINRVVVVFAAEFFIWLYVTGPVFNPIWKLNYPFKSIYSKG